MFKDIPSLPLGTYVFLSPKPPAHVLLCANSSCKLFFSKHPFRTPNLPVLQTCSVRVISSDPGGWLEHSQLIHHHREGRDRLTHHKKLCHPSLSLSLSLFLSPPPHQLRPPFPGFSFCRPGGGMEGVAPGLYFQLWILTADSRASGKFSLNITSAAPNLLPGTHQPVHSTLLLLCLPQSTYSIQSIILYRASAEHKLP